MRYYQLKTAIKTQLVESCCCSLEAVYHHSLFLCCRAAPPVRPLPAPCSPPLKQATHLVSFLLALSPLPCSNKGANHYNWHPADQLSQPGEVPCAEVWANRGIYEVCYSYSFGRTYMTRSLCADYSTFDMSPVKLG